MAKEAQPAAEQSAPAAPQKGGINKMLIIIGVPVFLVQLIFLYFIFTKLMGGSGSSSNESKSEKVSEKSEKKEEKGASEGEQKVFVIKDIIVNPSGTNGTRYLLTTVGIAVGSAELEKELTNKEVMVRDALNTILSAKQLSELTDMGAKDALKKEIEEKVNGMLENGKVSNVYFSKFIIQ
jgi:flagellar protein FliL